MVVKPDQSIENKIEVDTKIKIDYKLKIVSIITEKTEDNYLFIDTENMDFEDGNGSRIFISFDKNQHYKTMMIWNPKNILSNLSVMLFPTNEQKQTLLFSQCKLLN